MRIKPNTSIVDLRVMHKALCTRLLATSPKLALFAVYYKAANKISDKVIEAYKNSALISMRHGTK